MAVETKLDAVIEQNRRIAEKMDAILSSYVPRTEYEKDLEALELKIEAAKRKSAIQAWLTGSLSAVFGAVLAILVKAYFEK